MPNAPKGALSHVILFCYDLPKMVRFYTETLGFHRSDEGPARGETLVFMTLDPEIDHHMFGLCTGRTGPRDAAVVNHIAFRVKSMTDLRARYDTLRASPEASSIDPTNHGSWWSVYFRDPENNRMEFFVDAPWYVKQPVVTKLDLSLTDEQIFETTREKWGVDPTFTPMSEWKARTVKALAEEDA
jgi:catechol 2,3-dioxygenase-like lactoylglutathione lyase family enzyme